MPAKGERLPAKRKDCLTRRRDCLTRRTGCLPRERDCLPRGKTTCQGGEVAYQGERLPAKGERLPAKEKTTCQREEIACQGGASIGNLTSSSSVPTWKRKWTCWHPIVGQLQQQTTLTPNGKGERECDRLLWWCVMLNGGDCLNARIYKDTEIFILNQLAAFLLQNKHLVHIVYNMSFIKT